MKTLSFDGKGINGPDEYRSRIATFTSSLNAGTYGPLFEAAPDLLAALDGIFAQTAKHQRQWGQAEGALAFARDPDTAKAFFTAREALKHAKGQA